VQQLHAVLKIVLIAVLVTTCPGIASADDYYQIPQIPSDNGYPPSGQQQYQGPPGQPRYGIVPGPPSQPGQSIRPSSWPGGSPSGPNPGYGVVPAQYVAPVPPGAYPPVAGIQPGMPPQLARPQTPPVDDAKPCDNAQILARVGTDVVLTGDVVGGIDEMLNRNKDKIPAGQMEKQRAMMVTEATAGLGQLLAHMNEPKPGSFVDPNRRALIQQLLHQQIEVKMLYLDFRRTVPSEALPNIEAMLARQFEQSELKALMKRENVISQADLEMKLREKGSSIDREKRMFSERTIGQQWIHDQLNKGKDGIDEEVTHDQMLEWYQAHLTEFDKPARARWEELTVSFAKFPTHDAAYAMLAQWGNQVLAGAALADVAKAHSDGLTAAQGGRRDWTTKGALASDALDRALFSLPIGQMSPIIEGKAGYHIIRVSERQDATRTSFLDAQKEIKGKIRKERLAKQYKEFIEKLKKEFPVWTIFDDLAAKPKPGDAE
jgi:parvulin-like peptidyl-prolyl isomerase